MKFWFVVGLALVAVLSGSAASGATPLGTALPSGESNSVGRDQLPIGGEALEASLGCTVGFNVWRKGVPHFVTAAHCVENKGDDVYYNPTGLEGGEVRIGTVSAVWSVDEIHRDIAFIEYLPNLKLVPSSAVLQVREHNSLSGSIRIENQLEISGYADAYVGMEVCKTGRVTDTDCGEVTGFSSEKVEGGIITNICAEKGDSGAPLFTEEGKVVGILKGGDGSGRGSCSGHVETKKEPYVTIFQPVNILEDYGWEF